MAFAVTYLQIPTQDPQKPERTVFTVDLSRIGFEEGSYYSHLIDIDPDQEYMLGIDQSTTSTGIALVEKSFSFVLLFTIVIGSKSVYDRDRYVEVLLEFIEALVRNKKLLYVAMEEIPPAYGRTSHTYKVLRELKGRISSRLETFPAVRDLPKEMKFTPFPQQWKSTVYDRKEKGSKRFNQKAEIAKDIVKMFPWLEMYRKELASTHGHDFDGFDAFGMVTHVRLKHFSPDWGLMNRDSKYQAGAFVVLMKYVKSGQIFDDFVSYFSEWSTGIGADGKPRDLVDVRYWVSDESIYNNFIMAANTNKIACLICENTKLVLSYLVETGEKYDKDKQLCIAVCKHRSELVQDRIFPALRAEGFCCKKYYRS